MRWTLRTRPVHGADVPFHQRQTQQGAMGINWFPRVGLELEETFNGISDIQSVNAQPKRNDRFRKARASPQKYLEHDRLDEPSNSGAQVLISLTTALISAGFHYVSPEVGVTFGECAGLYADGAQPVYAGAKAYQLVHDVPIVVPESFDL